VRRRTAGWLAAVAAAVLLIDIVSKALVLAHLREGQPVRLLGGAIYLSLTRNTGAAFGLGSGYTAVLGVIAVAVVVVIVVFARRLRSLPWALALGLVLGGAAGNLMDRLFRGSVPFRGAVVDFLSLFSPYGTGWAIFNLADSALCVGVVIAVFLELTGRKFDGTRAGAGRRDAAAKGEKDRADETAGAGG
jgi:signal peptidase II